MGSEEFVSMTEIMHQCVNGLVTILATWVKTLVDLHGIVCPKGRLDPHRADVVAERKRLVEASAPNGWPSTTTRCVKRSLSVERRGVRRGTAKNELVQSEASSEVRGVARE